MAKKNLCGVEIEYAEDREFHDGIFHCYGPHVVNGEKVENDNYNFVTIESDDGSRINIVAMCPRLEDAHAIVRAMGIAKSVVDNAMGIAKSVVDNAVGKAKDSRDRLREVGYDLAAMEAKMDELMNEGKSPKEVSAYMFAHRSDFRTKKPDAKPTDDSKERW